MCEGYRFLPIPLAMSVCLPASPYVSVPLSLSTCLYLCLACVCLSLPHLCVLSVCPSALYLSFLTSPLWACEGAMWWCEQVGGGKAPG